MSLSGVCCRDEIGNISTSNLLKTDDSVEFEIRPRYPLFGGWKTFYYFGYNLPSYVHIFIRGRSTKSKLSTMINFNLFRVKFAKTLNSVQVEVDGG